MSAGLIRSSILLLFVGLLAVPLSADERILDYRSEIRIQPDGRLIVTEEIEVNAEGRQIRRGIYRDFPTVYRDVWGRRVTVPFTVHQVSRNGQPEPWHTQSITGGTRLYIGEQNTLLDPGRHRYRIEYSTDRQLGFFDDHDELYWNVTGNDWAFAIDRVSATVKLPAPVPPDAMRLDAYTGETGARGGDWKVTVTTADTVSFTSTRPLAPHEGMTIVVGFPKGLVAEPSEAERTRQMLADNRGAVIGMAGLLLVILWHAFAWSRVGRDPLPGVIYPRYDPPEGYSPGMLRYVMKYGYDRTATVAALVNMAVHGHLSIDKKDKHFRVRRGTGLPESPTERALFDALFAGGDTLEFKQANHARIRRAIKAHEKALRSRLESKYFRRNRIWWLPGLLISLISVGSMAAIAAEDQQGAALFLAVFAVIWNSIVAVVLWGLYKGLRQTRAQGGGVLAYVPLLLTGAFMVPFVVVGITVLGLFAYEAGLLMAMIVFGHVILNIVFYQLMKAPTTRGRKLLDQIQGLMLYLGVAERDDLEGRHRGDRPQTIEEFERLLPYAIALDCADTWAQRFEQAIRAAEVDGTLNNRGWYSPHMIDSASLSGKAIAGALASSLAAGISSAASPPGSSSGGGGGGFSGGGGGGGGGGGW
ncbi:MAG: DUF2207 domain-containing protein [Wenzhouxiangellaceae bacterium]